MLSRLLGIAIAAACFSLCLLITAPVLAQTEAAEPSTEEEEDDVWAGVEEMVVSSSAYGVIIPTSTSVTGFDSSELEAMGVENVADIAAFVPNLEIRTAAGTSASFFIRGVGLQDFGANATSAVAIFQDGISINAPALQLVGLFDVEGLTVLRGPQATGANRNASAGAIKMVSRKPSGRNEANARLSVYEVVSNKANNAKRYELDMGLGTSIVEDVLSSRFAFRFKRVEPMWENGCGGAPPVNQRPLNQPFCGETGGFLAPPLPAGLPTQVGEGDEWAGRGQLRLQPTDAIDIIFKLEGTRIHRDSTTGQSIGTGQQGSRLGGSDANGYTDRDIIAERQGLLNAGYSTAGGQNDSALSVALEDRLLDRPLDRGPYRGDINRVGKTRVETVSAVINPQVEFDTMTFAAHFGYSKYNRREDTDTDQTPNQAFEIVADDDAWQFYGDMGLSGVVDFADELRWDVGGYYLTEDLEYSSDILLGSTFINTWRKYRQETQSFGIWAGGEVDFFDNFTLEVGGRFNYEGKQFELDQKQGIRPIDTVNDHNDWQKPTWIASLTYRFTEDISTYFKYSRGFKAGHYNSNNAGGVDADPELLDAYEWGIAADLWESRISFNAQFFYYDYQDYQVFLLEDSPQNSPSLEVRNANDAINFGAEAELVFQPLLALVPETIEGLKAEVRPGWLKTRFLDFTDTELRRSGSTLFPVEADFSGNPLPSAPSWQVSGGIEWPFNFQEYGTIIPRWDFSWTDDVAFDPTTGRGSVDFNGNTRHPEYTIGQRSYALHNVRIDYRLMDETGAGFMVGGWCRNITDERYKRYAADVSAFQKLILNFVGEPRTCGMDLSLVW